MSSQPAQLLVPPVEEPALAEKDLPLCVDLDGTLLKTDLLLESALVLVKQRFLYLFLMPVWLVRGGIAHLKREIARRVRLNPALLPYRVAFVDWLGRQREKGRTLVLVTASDELLASPVAEQLGIFEAVYASDGARNLKGGRKAAFLVERFGARGFVYAGDAAADFPVWEQAAGAVVVGARPDVAARASQLAPVETSFPGERGGLRAFLKAIRVHQWAKNILVFIPVLTAHRITDLRLDLQAGIGFVAFSFCASAVYLANDLMDLEADRRHPRKRERPFASGKLPLWMGGAAPLFLLTAFGLSLLLPLAFTGVLALYLLVTNLYTFWLKREALLDVLCLAMLYTLRIFAGAESTDVPVSMWLIALSMFAFLSLALVKRVAELRVKAEASESSLHGRGYGVADLPVLSQAGMVSGYMSVLVFALYIHGDEVKALYRHPSVLWFICPLILYWITRVWLLTHRGRMHDDPVIFAVRDRPSYLIGFLAVVIAFLAR